jgi:phosphoglycolate phosphatase-like HAD superfamily hydrolase
MLIFFDIDATMITTGGAGIKAMIDAGRELYGPGFTADGIPFAGRLDPLIVADMLALNGREVSAPNMEAMRSAYRRHLAARLTPGIGRSLPGVLPLLDHLGRDDTVALGVLTGNYEETGSMKLRACGIDPGRFHIRVWGDDSPHHPPTRDHLPGVGFDRYRERYGRAVDPRRVTVVGDTPHDVACARAHGCRALGVATGQFTVEQLREAGADRAVRDLSDTAEIAAWLAR